MNVDVVRQEVDCGRCGQPVMLRASLPDPAEPGGYKHVALCPPCDATSLTARPLLAWFATHSQITDAGVHELAELLRTWLEDIGPPAVDAAELDRTVAAWTAAFT